jgi:hypothetical protein
MRRQTRKARKPTLDGPEVERIELPLDLGRGRCAGIHRP